MSVMTEVSPLVAAVVVVLRMRQAKAPATMTHAQPHKHTQRPGNAACDVIPLTNAELPPMGVLWGG